MSRQYNQPSAIPERDTSPAVLFHRLNEAVTRTYEQTVDGVPQRREPRQRVSSVYSSFLGYPRRSSYSPGDRATVVRTLDGLVGSFGEAPSTVSLFSTIAVNRRSPGYPGVDTNYETYYDQTRLTWETQAGQVDLWFNPPHTAGAEPEITVSGTAHGKHFRMSSADLEQYNEAARGQITARINLVLAEAGKTLDALQACTSPEPAQTELPTIYW